MKMFAFLRSKMALIAALASSAPIASAQFAVGYRDADIGGTLTFVMEGTPGDLYINILSLTEGPTCFPPPHTVGCIDVDLSLFSYSFIVPGLFGTFPGSGKVESTFGMPGNPAFDGVILREQAVKIVGGKFVEKSNLCRIQFGLPDTWRDSIGTIISDRETVPSVLLDDGRVLLAGGAGNNLELCETFDPCLQEFTAVASLHSGRLGHSVTKLADGRVLACGGADANGLPIASAELFDPATDTWTVVGSMTSIRAGHGANLLPDGRVLVTGGSTDLTDVLQAALSALKTTEYFDPTTTSFTTGPSMGLPHTGHTAVSLANGDVLIAGGASWFKIFGVPVPEINNDGQVYNATTGVWGSASTMKDARVGAGALLLADGRVLLAGGIGGVVTSPQQLDTSETFDPTTNIFTLRGTMSVARSTMAIVRLTPTNEVLVAGGATGTDITNPNPTDVVEIWSPTTGLFTVGPSLALPRGACSGNLLPTNHVGVFGGVGAVAPAAIYRD